RPIMMNTTASITTGSKSQTRKLVPKSTTRSPMPTRVQPMADWSRSGPDERRAPKSPPCPPRVVPDERGPPMSPSVSPSTVSDAAALYALPPGSSGPTIHAMMYSTTPAPPHSTVSSHASRTMVGSMLKYSATPAATPPKMRSCRERYKRLGALAAIGIASCIPRPGSGSAAAVPKTRPTPGPPGAAGPNSPPPSRGLHRVHHDVAPRITQLDAVRVQRFLHQFTQLPSQGPLRHRLGLGPDAQLDAGLADVGHAQHLGTGHQVFQRTLFAGFLECFLQDGDGPFHVLFKGNRHAEHGPHPVAHKVRHLAHFAVGNDVHLAAKRAN